MPRYKWAAFTKFLDVARDQALQNNVLLSGYEQKESVHDTCTNCGRTGHRSRKCPSAGGQRPNHATVGSSSTTAVTVTDHATKQEREKKARSDCGKCLL